MVLSNAICDCDRESKVSSSSPSPTQKHRRGKTGKARKKRRHWGLFSKWKTSESEDDDDLELYRWSKSRGLTARILPPQSTQPNETTQKASRMRYNDSTESKSTADHRTTGNSNKHESLKRIASSNSIATLQENIFLTKLCPSIRDKKMFVEQSKNNNEVEEKQTKKALADKNVAGLSHQKQVQKPVQQTNRDSCGKADKEDESVAVEQKFESSLPVKEEPSLKSTKEAKIDEKTGEISTVMKNEASHSGNQSSTSPEPAPPSSPSPLLHLSKKEWSASVESDILRLYESTSTIQTNTNLICSWAATNVAPAPTKQSSIPQAVEQKIEQAEYTPSYVQMLAKMFKTRMQIRKEREERVEENLKRSKLSFDCVGNGTYSAKSDRVLPKTTSYGLSNPSPISRAHLRYRHLGDKKDSHSHQLEITQTIRIDQLDVGYTHGRYSKALKYYPDHSTGKMSTANGNTLNAHTLDGSIGGHSSVKEMSKYDDKPTDIHRGFFRLYDGDLSAKLQKPTPHLTPFKPTCKQDTKSTLLLAKKARKSFSYSKTKPNEINDIMRGSKTGRMDGETNELFEYSPSPVRWSTSVGSLYCRPPARLLSRATAQKA